MNHIKFYKIHFFSLSQISDFPSDFITQLVFHFPILERFFPNFTESFDKLHEAASQVYAARKAAVGNNDRIDFIKQMIDLKSDIAKDPKISEMINDDVIFAQIAVMFLAGLETVGTLLTNLFYELAINQKIQDELIEEIDEFLARSDDNFKADDLNDLEFLDACISESIRVCPPISGHNRMCVQDIEIKGIRYEINPLYN